MHTVSKLENQGTLSNQIAASNLPEAVKRRALVSLKEGDAVVTVTHYSDGWVPNSYRWPSTGRVVIYIFADNLATRSETTYSRKRSGGTGPEWLCHVAKVGQKKGRLV